MLQACFSKSIFSCRSGKLFRQESSDGKSQDTKGLARVNQFAPEKPETKNPITAQAVIGFNNVWRAWQDSNLLPAA